MCFVACNEQPEHTHTFVEWDVTKNPTCTENGEKLRYCDCGEEQSESIPTLNHTEVIDEAVAPTCTEVGKTEGKHCSTCNQVIVAQSDVAKVEHTYNDTYSFDNSFHWYECKTCGTNIDIVEHSAADNGICSVCDQPVGPTEGIVYDISDDGTYALVVSYKGTAQNIRISDTYNELPVTTINNKAFNYSKKITSVIIPNSVATIGANAFSGCSKLTSVEIGNGVISIGASAFESCTNLTSIIIPDSVTSIGDKAFYNCFNLSSVEIGDSVISIGEYAFCACHALTSIKIPDSVISLGKSVFSLCYSLTSVEIGNGVTSIGFSSFDSCSSLTSVEIGDGVTFISNSAFSFCTSLISISLSNNITSIGTNAFYGCEKLRSVEIPDSVVHIGGWAFWGCSMEIFNEYEDGRYLGNKDNPYYVLVEVEIEPSSCIIHKDTKLIADYTFYNSYYLEEVYYIGSEEEWLAIEINSDGNNYLTNATIHYNYVPEN